MSFVNPEQQAKRGGPHPDMRRNVNEFYRVIKSAWMPDCEYEINAADGKSFGNWKVSDTQTSSIFNPETGTNEQTMQVIEYKNVTFVWGKKNRFKHSHPISFHQKQYKTEDDMGFNAELTAVLNLIRKECGE